MTADARGQYLEGVRALKSAIEADVVRDATSTGAFLRRGITVAAFNLLETFVADRIRELAAHANAGQTQFLDLPEPLQRRAVRQTVDVAQAHLRRTNLPLQELREFSARIGQSLSAVTARLSLSPFVWMWPGSNIGAQEYFDALKYLHVARPREAVLDLSGRLGFNTLSPTGDRISVDSELRDLVAERNRCAHVASHQVTTLSIRSLPSRIDRFAVTFDILASLSAHRIFLGDTAFLGDPEWMSASRVGLRFVRARKRDFAEFLDGSQRARRVDRDAKTLVRKSRAAASPLDAVVVQDIAGAVTEWSIPHVP